VGAAVENFILRRKLGMGNLIRARPYVGEVHESPSGAL
jgi:hypothetical protein